MAETLIAVSEAFGQLPEHLQNLFIPYVPTRAGNGDVPVNPTIVRLLAAQGNQCAICGGDMRLHGSVTNHRRATLDHVRPRSRGGRRSGNVLLAHRICNIRKADRPPFPCELLLLEAVNLRLPQPASANQSIGG